MSSLSYGISSGDETAAMTPFNLTVTSAQPAVHVGVKLRNCQPAGDWCGEDYDMYKVVVDVYVVLAVCVVGLVGNALTVAVLRRDNDPSNTTNWLLQSLAITDTIYLLSAIVIQVSFIID